MVGIVGVSGSTSRRWPWAPSVPVSVDADLSTIPDAEWRPPGGSCRFSQSYPTALAHSSGRESLVCDPIGTSTELLNIVR